MFCPKCGSQLNNDAKYCQRCGSPVPQYREAPKQPKKKKRVVLIAVGLCIVALAGLGYTLLFAGNEADIGMSYKKAQETVIKPDGKSAAVNFGDIRIHIPEGTVEKEEKLTISDVKGMPPLMEGLTELCPPFDVKLGGIREFKNPLLIEIPYDQNKLGGLEPGEAFTAVYYNEMTAKWADVPYTVDETKGVVQLQMYHLTTVQCYYSYWEGARVYDSGSALVIFNLHERDRKIYAEYERITGKTAADPIRPQMVADIAGYAQKIMKAYTDAGLTITGKPKIYLTSNNNYNSSSGNLALDMNILYDSDPEKMIARNIAHELFHKAQQDTLGSYAYNKTILTNTSFWMEATADYMANKGVWLLLGEQPVNKFEVYGMSFYEKELFEMDGSHEYAAADFVDFTVSMQAATPLQLVKLAEESSALSSLNFENRFNQVFKNSNYSSLLSYYDGFLEYSLFDNSSKYTQKNNTQMEGAFAAYTELKFEPDTAGLAKNPVLEGAEKILVPGDFTAGFYRFTADMDTTLEITGDSPLVMYSVDRTRTDRGFTRRVETVGGKTASINFSKDEFVLLAATGGTKKTVGIRYKAAPITVSAKEVSGIVPLKFRFPNGAVPPPTSENKGFKVALQKWDHVQKYFLSILIVTGSGIYEEGDYFYRIDTFKWTKNEDFLLKAGNEGTLFVEGEADIEYLTLQYRAISNREWKTVPIKAILTPKEDGYDFMIDIDGIVSEGRLK